VKYWPQWQSHSYVVVNKICLKPNNEETQKMAIAHMNLLSNELINMFTSTRLAMALSYSPLIAWAVARLYCIIALALVRSRGDHGKNEPKTQIIITQGGFNNSSWCDHTVVRFTGISCNNCDTNILSPLTNVTLYWLHLAKSSINILHWYVLLKIDFSWHLGFAFNAILLWEIHSRNKNHYCDLKRQLYRKAWVRQWLLFNSKWSIVSAVSGWEQVTFCWYKDDICFVLK